MPTASTRITHAFSRSVGRILAALAALSVARERRRIVGELGALDDRMLSDIGITRQDVLSVLAEPLYRDPSEQLAQRAADARRGRRSAAVAARDYVAGYSDEPAPTGRRAA